ncbi:MULTISPECIES: DUF5701 family protein [unclassified Nocardiopsis]|uniref:DUF5701 family protein n=1 Tax=unclassified Nocardiopsis TaxID=2649073 RepID=UPI001916B832|nr:MULTISPECIES: DUF5701 family protein [unclassified Nocardiopsis]
MTTIDAGAEFDRQTNNLIELGYPGMGGLTPERFQTLAAPLRDVAAQAGNTAYEPGTGRIPFVLVVTREVVPIERMMPRTALRGKAKPGFVDPSFEPGSLERFAAIEETGLTDQPVYLLSDIERGEEFCGAVPRDAMDTITARNRTPLTIEEGIAVITRFPEALVKNKCFSLGGSRSGDRRATA